MARLARDNVNMPKYDLRRPSLKWRCTSSCAQNLIPTCLTTYPGAARIPRLDLPQDVAGPRAVACPYLKGQRERILYSGISARKRRYVHAYVKNLLFSIQSGCANLLSYSVSPYPRITVQFQYPARLRRYLVPRTPFEQKPKSPPFPLLPHSASPLLFLRPRT